MSLVSDAPEAPGLRAEHRDTASGALVAAIAPVLIGVSRIYRGMHHPTDLATGYVMGILCVIAAVFIVRVTGVVEQEHEQRKVAA